MRKKLKLAFIVNDSARKISYMKRKKNLIKKTNELATICGIEACAIISSPFDSNPELWPSPNEVQRVVNKFRTYPEFVQSRKMFDQESFLKESFVKVLDQLAKVRKNNREKEMYLLMFEYLTRGNVMDNLSMVDSSYLSLMVNDKLDEVNKRISELSVKALATQNQSQVVEQVVEDGATRQGKKALVDHDQGIEMNMDAAQNASWISELMNSGGEDAWLPFGGENYYKI